MAARGLSLRTPADARRAIKKIVTKIFKEGSEIENAGRVANLLNTFLRAWEIEKVSDVEKRLDKLEQSVEESR